MTQEPQKPTPEDSGAGHDGDGASGANDGTSNPSHATRFQKGRSGNPTGRRKGSWNKSTIVEKAINKTITVREGKHSRTVTKFEVIVTQMVNDAAKGDSKAQAQVLAWIKVFNLVDQLPRPDLKPLTANDDALWQDVLARMRDESSPGKNQNPEAGQ